MVRLSRPHRPPHPPSQRLGPEELLPHRPQFLLVRPTVPAAGEMPVPVRGTKPPPRAAVWSPRRPAAPRASKSQSTRHARGLGTGGERSDSEVVRRQFVGAVNPRGAACDECDADGESCAVVGHFDPEPAIIDVAGRDVPEGDVACLGSGGARGRSECPGESAAGAAAAQFILMRSTYLESHCVQRITGAEPRHMFATGRDPYAYPIDRNPPDSCIMIQNQIKVGAISRLEGNVKITVAGSAEARCAGKRGSRLKCE